MPRYGGAAVHRAAAGARGGMRSTLSASGSVRGSSGPVFTGQLTNHAVFDWVDVCVGKELEEHNPEEIVKERGLRERVLAKYLQSSLQGEKAVLSLPWAALSVFLFALMMLQHENYTLRHSNTAAIDHDIAENANFAFVSDFGGKGYQDVNSFADFWSWMVKGFMPLVHVQETPTSEDSALDLGSVSGQEAFAYLKHHRRIGPVKLSQELAQEKPCANREVASVLNLTCTVTPNRHADMQPAVYQTVQAQFNEDRSKTVFFNDFLNESHKKLQELERDEWLQPRTSVARVSLLTFQGDSDLLILTDVNFIFSRSGRIWKVITHQVMKLQLYDSAATYILDILFYLQVAYLMVKEVKEVALSFKHHGLRNGLKEYMDIWNAIDWAFVIGGLILLVLWLVRVQLTNEVQAMLLDLPTEASSCTSSTCADFWAALFDRVVSVGQYSTSVRYVGAAFPMIIMCRLFKAFSAQPRLALVTVSLGKAASELTHYLIVFLAVFGTYAVLGTALFGREIVSFATLDRAVPTLFRMLNGDFDYSELQIVGRLFAFATFISFMWLMQMVMLSMLISIIMDWYCMVKEHALKTSTLWRQVYLIFRRGIDNYRGTRLSLDKVEGKFSTDCEDVITVTDMCQRVSGLGQEQALELATDAVDEWASLNALEPEATEVSLELEKVTLSLNGLPAVVDKMEDISTSRGTWDVQDLKKHISFEHLLNLAHQRLPVEGGGDLATPGLAEAMRDLMESAHESSQRILHQISV